MLKEHKEIAIVDEADNTESALFKFLELRPDIVFLDLIMPGKNGMEFISLVKKQKLNTNIVIVSAYRDMAIEAIRNEVYDFILKPIGPRKLNKAIEAIIKRKEEHVSTELNAIFDQYKQETKLTHFVKTTAIRLLIPKKLYTAKHKAPTRTSIWIMEKLNYPVTTLGALAKSSANIVFLELAVRS